MRHILNDIQSSVSVLYLCNIISCFKATVACNNMNLLLKKFTKLKYDCFSFVSGKKTKKHQKPFFICRGVAAWGDMKVNFA